MHLYGYSLLIYESYPQQLRRGEKRLFCTVYGSHWDGQLRGRNTTTELLDTTASKNTKKKKKESYNAVYDLYGQSLGPTLLQLCPQQTWTDDVNIQRNIQRIQDFGVRSGQINDTGFRL